MREIKNPENFRNKMAQKLFLKFKEINPDFNKQSLSINLEKGIYNNCLEIATKKKLVKKWDNSSFLNLYITKFKSIYYNITLDLITKLLHKEIKPHEIAFMTHQQLQPEKWSKLIESKKIKDE